MLQSTSIGDNTARRNCTIAQCPEEAFKPVILFPLAFHLGQCPGNATIGGINGLIHCIAMLVFKAVFLVPDIFRGSLQLDINRGCFCICF